MGRVENPLGLELLGIPAAILIDRLDDANAVRRGLALLGDADALDSDRQSFLQARVGLIDGLVNGCGVLRDRIGKILEEYDELREMMILDRHSVYGC